MHVQCPRCKGTGSNNEFDCALCGGRGHVEEDIANSYKGDPMLPKEFVDEIMALPEDSPERCLLQFHQAAEKYADSLEKHGKDTTAAVFAKGMLDLMRTIHLANLIDTLMEPEQKEHLDG